MALPSAGKPNEIDMSTPIIAASPAQFIALIFSRALRLLAPAAVCLLAPLALAGNLSASVDKSTLGLDETLTLQLTYDERISGEQPNLDGLRKSFDILSNRTEAATQIINNNIITYTRWVIDLAPRHIGQATIPAFSIRGATSDPIDINVTGKSQQAQQNAIRIDTLVNQQNPYVQQQVMLTLRLTLDAGLALNGGNMEPLNVKDALVLQLDENKYQTNEQGKLLNVIENRYLIYPQISGELVIPALLFQLDVGSGNNRWDMRLFGGSRGNLMRLRSDEKILQVQAIPQDPRAQPWLPAEEITLEEHWSNSPDQLRVGEPVTRTLRLHAKGLSAAQIPPLPTQSLAAQQGLSSYQDQAQTEEQKTSEGITGTRIETTAIVANRSGSYELPAVKINWWDTRSGQFKTAELPARRLRVSGIDGQHRDDSSSDSDELPAPPQTHNPEATTPVPSETTGSSAAPIPNWLYVALATSLLLNLLLLALYLRARRSGGHYSAVMDAFNKRTQSAQQQAESEKAAWQQLRQTLAEGDNTQLRNALLYWGQQHLPNSGITNLERLGQAFSNSELHQQLLALDNSLYGKNSTGPDRNALKAILANLRKHPSKQQGPALKPLYPE